MVVNMKYTIKSKTKFYIGDPCYVLKDEIYDNVWGGANYADGVHTDPETGLQFAVVSTVIGDGCYSARFLESAPMGARNNYYAFPVDAGAIAIIPVELCDVEKLAEALIEGDEYGYVFNYDGEVSISRDGNTWNDDIFIFVNWAGKTLEIEVQYTDTDLDEEDDDGYEYEDEDDYLDLDF